MRISNDRRGIVLQSYKMGAIPEWMSKCQTSVKAWARSSNLDYKFLDDELFDGVPDWAVERAHGQKLILSDWGRLTWMRRALTNGWATVVWIDFDVIIFDPSFSVTFETPICACDEWWLQRSQQNTMVIKRAINNSVIAARRDGLPIIDFLLRTAAARLRIAIEKPDPRIIGTDLLTELARTWRIPTRRDLITASPHLLNDIVTNNQEMIVALRRLEPTKSTAANLCGSFVGRNFQGIEVTNALMLSAVEHIQSGMVFS